MTPMPSPSDDPSIFREPHLQAGPCPPDPSEQKVERVLRYGCTDREREIASGQSVYEEPDIFPGRADDLIAQDWSCSACGYNLRGLPAGHPCPECGHHELYRPAPPEARGYGAWLRDRLARSSPSIGWYVALGVALIGGPFAVIGALAGTRPTGLMGTSHVLLAILFAPLVEETLKLAGAAIIVETRPYLFRRAGQVQAAAIGSALVFAAVENFLYLSVYVPDPTTSTILWRWTVCLALHLVCSGVASQGLVGIWQQTVTELRPPQARLGMPRLVTAVIIHGSYNAIMLAYELAFGPIV
jgi:predicted RNA-binding Zn-ribbon protein involved in translation (DUF1610 family)